jgi:hypothetical protein
MCHHTVLQKLTNISGEYAASMFKAKHKQQTEEAAKKKTRFRYRHVKENQQEIGEGNLVLVQIRVAL